MTPSANDVPKWLRDQIGISYADARADRKVGSLYMSKKAIIRGYAEHLVQRGEALTYSKVRTVLEMLGRGYQTKTDQISFALHIHRHRSKRFRVDPYPNGFAVQAGKHRYRSLRDAAAGEGVAIETVRRRIRSAKFSEWKMAPARKKTD